MKISELEKSFQYIGGAANRYELPQAAYERLRFINAQREKVLEAFIAKYGFEPERFVQVHQRFNDGREEWSVRRRTDAEMEELSRMSSAL